VQHQINRAQEEYKVDVEEEEKPEEKPEEKFEENQRDHEYEEQAKNCSLVLLGVLLVLLRLLVFFVRLDL